MIGLVLAKQPQRKADVRLKNLNAAAEASGEIKEDVLDPLKSSASLSHAHGIEGLGMAGGALGGVNGFGTMIKGVRTANPRMVLAGVAETTAAAASLAVIGLVGGAHWLAPLGAGMLFIRGIHRTASPMRSERFDGVADAVTGTALLVSAMHASPALVLGVGFTAVAVGSLRGLHRIFDGHRHKEPRLNIRGTGEVVSSLGLATLLCGGPGMALVFGGASLALLQRVPALRPHVNRVVNVADKVLNPLSKQSEKLLSGAQTVLRPVGEGISRLVARADKASTPLLDPVAAASRKIGDRTMKASGNLLERLSHNPIFHKIDAAVGAVRNTLLPEPEAEKDDTKRPA